MNESVNARDQMICRSCEQQERASEGYPCQRCSTFICVVCNMQGITHCKSCQAKIAAKKGV